MELRPFLRHGTLYKNMALNFDYPIKTWDDSMPVPEPHEFTPNIDYESIEAVKDQVKGKPVVVVGSGPSLDKNISLLKGAPDDWVIFSCDGSIHTLAKHRIKPDFVVTSELEGRHSRRPGVLSTDMILNGMDKDFYADVPLLCPTWVSCSFLKHWPCERRYWYIDADIRHAEPAEKFGYVMPDGLPAIKPRATIVGFHAVELAKALEASEIILLGCDMSATRTKHHAADFNLSWENTDTDLEGVYENHWRWFQRHYDAKFDYNVTNCTEGGVMVEGATDAKVMTLNERINQ